MTPAAARYDAANRQTLEWMLSRTALKGAFLDTKVDPLTGRDYGEKDGLRGPGWIYGWIQGRGLEALATFARHYQNTDPDLAALLRTRLTPLYHRLAAMVAGAGHAFFLYDPDMLPVRAQGKSVVAAQAAEQVWTYSDAFVAKGLVAAAALIAPDDLPRHLTALARVIAAVEGGRFQIDETLPLGSAALAAQPDDFGPRMILLGAAGMLARAGPTDAAEPWASRFIDHVLTRHFDPDAGILRNVPGADALNAGHGIEFVGFALDHFGAGADPGLLQTLAQILDRSLRLAMQGPGIVLSVSVASGQPLSPYHPWWCLPEAIRACALARRHGLGDDLAGWQARADAAFFGRYWQAAKGYAYQTLDANGPVNFVPATPDLDPGYHTGLSLLAAVREGD